MNGGETLYIHIPKPPTENDSTWPAEVMLYTDRRRDEIPLQKGDILYKVTLLKRWVARPAPAPITLNEEYNG